MTQTATEELDQPATLSKALTEFLIEFSIGVHRYAMYPVGHPSHEPVLGNIMERLSDLFLNRDTVSIGVAARQLVIEGTATDPKHPVLADLAKRLHDHQLGALSFERAVTSTELAQMLELVASESSRDGAPIGLREGDDFPQWQYARMHPVGYEQLKLKDSSGAESSGHMDRASALWLGLAQAALATEGSLPAAPDAESVARNIEGHDREPAYDQAVVGYMLQLTEELKGADDGEAEQVRERVSNLMTELDDGTLQHLVRFGGNTAQQRRFVLDANESLAVDSVMKVVTAAAASSEQTISSSMTRMLSKLSMHAGAGGSAVKSQADSALRENVEALMDGWELKDPNPEAYTTVLDRMATSAPVFDTADDAENITGAVRLVQMALEVDAYGPFISKALQDMVEQGETSLLLQMIREFPSGNGMVGRIKQHLTSPDEFRRLLASGTVDIEELRALVDEMGTRAVDPLLDVLADSDSRAVRRRVFDALQGLGSYVGRRAIERLDDSRWFVQRNMLALVQRLEDVPDDFNLKPFLEHTDHRVRREALPIAMRPGSDLRDPSLVTALGDDDERMVRMALLQIQEEIPAAAMLTLVNRVVKAETRSIEVRTMAIACLKHTDHGLARAALLSVVAGGKTLFGKAKVTAKNPASLGALRILAGKWSGSPDVDEVLALASRSKDPDIRGAISVAGGPT